MILAIVPFEATNVLIAVLIHIAVAVIILYKCIVVVPQRSAYIVQRLGRYSSTFEAGIHLLAPFIDRIAYRHTLKEQVIDVPPQSCITRDNIAVDVDGVLYLRVVDPVKASYGVSNYLFASVQLAQTTMRSEMGKLDLDRSFKEREQINAAIVAAVGNASDPWGVIVTRYEIKNITPPKTIKDTMEMQFRAEREKRAMIIESEGEREAKMNRNEAEQFEASAKAEAEKARRIYEAESKIRVRKIYTNFSQEGLCALLRDHSSTSDATQ